MHMELLCTYGHFKSRLSNDHPTMPHFFIDEPSHLSNGIAEQVRGWWKGSSVKK
jgi:hypothetical protein